MENKKHILQENYERLFRSNLNEGLTVGQLEQAVKKLEEATEMVAGINAKYGLPRNKATLPLSKKVYDASKLLREAAKDAKKILKQYK